MHEKGSRRRRAGLGPSELVIGPPSGRDRTPDRTMCLSEALCSHWNALSRYASLFTRTALASAPAFLTEAQISVAGFAS